MELSLEKEFEEFKLLHKAAIIKGVALKYYSDLYDISILPIENKKEIVEKKASDYLIEIMNNDNNFNEVYQNCWERIKELLP